MTAKTIAFSHPFLQIDNQGQIVNFELTKPHYILGRDPSVADISVPDSWQIISRRQATFRQDGEDYYVFDGDGQTPSSNRLYVNQTLITPQQGYRLTNGMCFNIGLDPKTLIQVTYINPNASKPTNIKFGNKTVSLKQETISIGRDPNAKLQLDAPTICRNHATINQDRSGRYILRDHSINGVFVNDQRVIQAAIIADGATITIAPFTLVVRGDEIQILDRGKQIRLDVHNLSLETNGKRRLDNISFSLEPGQFVALVGASGVGKSTLIRTLLGIEAPNQGIVYLNGTDLRQNFNIYRTQIGYVPQAEIVHMNLSVEEALIYAARLRLPPDIDLESVVDRVLNDLKLTHRRTAMIANLSSEQRKWVSIGVELLTNPKLLFLDESTAGLDPGLDKQMMELLRDIAHQDGRIIVLATQSTTNITECDRTIFLGKDGKLCYFGAPTEALNFFGVTSFADIYIKLKEDAQIDRYVDSYNKSSYFQTYVTSTLSPTTNHNTLLPPPTAKPVNPIRQWLMFTQRQFSLITRDQVNLGLALFTAPAGLSLIKLALWDRDPFRVGSSPDPGLPNLAVQVLFILTCAVLWVGLSSSLPEIVTERAIYLRERLINLRIPAYVGSKFAVLTALAIVQSILVTIVISIGFNSPAPGLISWQLGIFINTFLTLTASFSLGLLVSAAVNNSSQANRILPIILLPQIIFSGVLFKLQGVGSIISYLMLSRWAMGACGTIANLNNLVPTAVRTKAIADLPFPTGIAYEHTWENLSFNWLMLIIHITIYLGVTAWLQIRKDLKLN
jgi:ABC transport system ATP-binding/permease protein